MVKLEASTTLVSVPRKAPLLLRSAMDKLPEASELALASLTSTLVTIEPTAAGPSTVMPTHEPGVSQKVDPVLAGLQVSVGCRCHQVPRAEALVHGSVQPASSPCGGAISRGVEGGNDGGSGGG